MVTYLPTHLPSYTTTYLPGPPYLPTHTYIPTYNGAGATHNKKTFCASRFMRCKKTPKPFKRHAVPVGAQQAMPGGFGVAATMGASTVRFRVEGLWV